MSTKRLPKEVADFKEEWVAISSDGSQIVGHGKTPADASKQADEAGERDYILFYIPAEWPQTLVV